MDSLIHKNETILFYSFPFSMFPIIHSHKDLIVWQKAIELVCLVYEITEQFPKEEIYGLTSQMRRSAISIPSNIAEGRRRGSRNDFLHFLRIASASGAELETQITISKKLPKMKHLNYEKMEALLEEVMKMLSSMIAKLNPTRSKSYAAR